jgi:hypothetical protein
MAHSEIQLYNLIIEMFKVTVLLLKLLLSSEKLFLYLKMNNMDYGSQVSRPLNY